MCFFVSQPLTEELMRPGEYSGPGGAQSHGYIGLFKLDVEV
jgi:hypothetical protein